MQIFRAHALSLVGLPYRWGGDDPMAGFDCSGLAIELLTAHGAYDGPDTTAQGLFNHFQDKGAWNVFRCGALAFYGKTTKKITHMGILIDPYRTVEAGGGGSQTKTVADAIRQNACVRVRLIDHRRDRLAIIRPMFLKIGVYS